MGHNIGPYTYGPIYAYGAEHSYLTYQYIAVCVQPATTGIYIHTYVDENLGVKHSKHAIIVVVLVMRHFKCSWMLLSHY